MALILSASMTLSNGAVLSAAAAPGGSVEVLMDGEEISGSSTSVNETGTIGDTLYQADLSNGDGFDFFKGASQGEGMQIQDGKLVLTGGNGNKAVAKDQNFTDFVYEADVTVEERRDSTWEAQGGIIFRVSNPNPGADGYEGYYLGLNAGEQFLVLGKAANSGKVWTEIATKKMKIEYGRTYHLKVTAYGNHITCYVDDNSKNYAKIDVTDNSYASGSVGARTWYSKTSFTNMTVAEYQETLPSEEESYTNPLLNHCADPDVLYHDGTYYLYPTNAGDSSQGFKVYTSTDLVHWTEKGWAFRKGDGWGTTGFWAPDTIERDGKFYMYYTANEQVCVAVSDSPLGPYRQETMEPMWNDEHNIDAHVFQDDDGQYYIYFVRFDNGNVIWGAKLNDDMMTFDKSTLKMIVRADQKWDQDMGNINEGPFMLKKDGKYYLTYSGAHFESNNYGCGYAVSDSPLGDFVKYESNPILKSNSLVHGSGHHCITTSPDGTEMFMVYHMHHDLENTEPRQLCIDRMQFAEDADGNTVLEVKGPTVTPQALPSGSSDVNNFIEFKKEDLQDITVEHGTPVSEWGLPEQIGVVTSKNDFMADVTWDVSGYDASVTEKQVVTVKGTAVLPEGVENLGNLPVEPEIQVTVKKAAAEEKTNFQGLCAEYWTTRGSGTNVEFNTKKSESVDYVIDYGDMDGKLSRQTGLSDYAGVRWTGRIRVPESGNYTFYGLSDNGIRLWINGEQLIDYWNGDSWSIEQKTKEVYLEAGKDYEFRMDYFEHVGGSLVHLYWKNDQSIEKEIVPETAFFLPADYEGLYISDFETDGELKEGETAEKTILVNGTGFDENTKFEVVKAGGASLAEPAFAEVVSAENDKAQVRLPDLKVGTYKLLASSGIKNVTSAANLVVMPVSEQGQTRTEQPRPDWERADYVNLNGWWDFSFDSREEGQDKEWYRADKKFDQMINVPFCWESSLSGIQNPDYKGQAWYQKKITVDKDWDGRKLFLKFGAVDWKCKLWVNGEEVGEHIGGYSAFEFDVTDYLKAGEENTITLWVEDKGNYGDDSYPALVGKQGKNAPCGYNHTSGIWQTVGLEARSATYLDRARANADIDQSAVTYDLDITSDSDQELTVEYDFVSKIYDIDQDADIPTGSAVKGTQKISVKAGSSTVSMDAISIENAKLWNYNDPNLYYGTLTVKDAAGKVLDQVNTYFGMRKVEQKYFDESLGTKYVYINNSPVYMSGLLDQGFWEEGIYTAPSEEALKYDILQMRETGFNMIRKHLKAEDPLQYYWCDKLGMLVWQDMPHATAMVPKEDGDEALGRVYYEECLEATLNRDYNHPSVVALMLFNETWGLQTAYFDGKRGVVASDGMSTGDWVEYLFNKAKDLNPNILVEDMSPCNSDHVQPTEMNTYHMYPSNYQGTLSTVESMVNGTYEGSTKNFKFGYQQDGDVMMNSEYGGVAAYDGDYDVSYCFKFMTDIQRRYEQQSGFVYTEPYDVEYERNGIMTYDRNMKIFGYEEAAWGGDMSIRDLVQEIYVGIVDQPIRNVQPGQRMKTKALAIGWTEDMPENVVMKWRFDGTDIYGNQISTGKSGEKALTMSPYRKTTVTIAYDAPEQACVGTLTVWLEDTEGNKLAKNFTNVVVADNTSKNEASVKTYEDGSVVMKAAVGDSKMVSTVGTGEQTYSYALPEDFDLNSLKSMRLLAEASSCKGQIGTDKDSSTYSKDTSQTAIGRERASDLTVSVNGVEVDTVYLPDNPRDIRGTLTLDKFVYSGKTNSAGDFGYLVNLNVSDEQLAAIRATLDESRELQVTYAVKEDAANKNGLRIYSSTYGRYAVNPTLILNGADTKVDGVLAQEKEIATEEDNYSVEAVLENGEGYLVRNDNDGGYQVKVAEDGSKILLVNNKTEEILASAEISEESAHEVKVTLFDDKIRVYTDNDPEPVICVYDQSGFTGDVTVWAGAEDVVVAPETYQTEAGAVTEVQTDVDITDDFSDADLDARYEKMGNDLSVSVQDEALKISGRSGDKLIRKDLWVADAVYEADITITALSESGGNTGLTVRSSNYQVGSDGLDGYYAGIGNGYVQLGRMNNNWKELARVNLPQLTVGSTHRLKVVTFDSRIQIYVDDSEKPYIDMVDTTYTVGGVSIRNFQDTALVDNLRITTIPDYISDFEHGVDEWDTDGTWKNQNDVYTVTGNKNTAFLDASELKDAVVAADLKAESEDGMPGLAVRAQGADGYHAVLNVKEDKLQLVKTENGTDTVLAERGWKLEKDTAYRVAVEMKGQSLKVYLDGRAMLAAEDASFEKGQVGLYNTSGASVYDNMAVNTDYQDGELLPEAETEEYEKLLADAKGRDESKYIEITYENLLTAIQTAEAVNPYDPAEVEEAINLLRDALDHLVEKGGDITQADLDKIMEEVRKAQQQASEAKDAADKAQAAADKAQADADKAQAEIDKAKEDVQKAQSEAEKAAEEAAAAKAEAVKAKEEAAQAKTEAEAAKGDAAAAQQKADAAQKAAEEAQAKADAAQKAAEEAQAKAGEALKNAEAIQAAAEEALRIAKETQTKAEAAQKAAEDAAADAKAAQKAAEDAKAAADKDRQEAQEKIQEAEQAVRDAQAKAEAAEQAMKDAQAKAEAAEKAMKEAQEALMASQKEDHKTPAPAPAPVKKGDTYSDGKLNYKVTSTAAKTVSVTGAVSKTAKAVTIPAAVTIQGASYKVTAVAKGAFQNNRKLAKAVIGANVKKIGAKAFYKDSRLKRIIVKSRVLKAAGKNALKGIAKNAVIKVPAAKYKAYAKLLAKKGQKRTVKIKK